MNERNFEFVAWNSRELDIRSAADCDLRIANLKPDIVINAAAWTDVDGAESNCQDAHAVNAEGAVNLASAASSINAIFAQVSTDYVFSGEAKRPWPENAKRDPISAYGATKAAGEEGVLSIYESRSYIFRTAWLYSVWGKNFAKTMARLALNGDGEVAVVKDQFGQPTFAHDLANQIADSLTARLPFGIYHATNAGQASWFEFAQEIFSLCNSSIDRVKPIGSDQFVRPARRPTYSVLAHDAWNHIGERGRKVPAMRDWRESLASAMPSIISAIREE